MTLTRLAVVAAAAVPFASGVFWLYLHAVSTAYYGAFGVTLEQIGLDQSTILARAGGWTLLLATVVLGPYVFVVMCARAILDAGKAHAPRWSAGVSFAMLLLTMVALLALATQVTNGAAVLILIVCALVLVSVAGAVLVVDSWDRAARVRAASRYARFPLVVVLLFLTAFCAYGSIEAAPTAARQAFGSPVRSQTSDIFLSSFGEAMASFFVEPQVVAVQIRPVGEDVAGLCRLDEGIAYLRLGWTPDALTLIEADQVRAGPTISRGKAFSVITVPSDAYSIRTLGRLGGVAPPCF